MTLNLASSAYLHPGLNLRKRADRRVVSDHAFVEVRKGTDDDVLAEPAVANQAAGGVVGGPLEHAGTIVAADRPDHLRATIKALERWGSERDWVGPDPYEGLNAGRAPATLLRRSPLGRRLLIQAVRRSPLDLRRPLGIRPEVDAATLAHVLSAYCRLPADLVSGPDRDAAIEAIAARLIELRCAECPEPAWAYHFDVETRFFFYARTTPNTIATAFAAHALLDAHAATGNAEFLETARGAAEFFLHRVGLTDAPGGGFFGYFPGDHTPIHNASLLGASVPARLSALRGEPNDEGAAAARIALGFAIDHQRDDGSWPYAEGERGNWVDGFHTGYVLDALAVCGSALEDPRAADAHARGLAFYRDKLILDDGTPRYFIDSTFPIDSQSAAQAIRTFAIAGEADPDSLETAWGVYHYAVAKLLRSDGAFVFQRTRLGVNRTPHVRWVQAPMLEALSVLLAASEKQGASP